MINVPENVENEAAYIAAAYGRIARNARKTTLKRMENDPEFFELINYITAQADKGQPFFKSLRETLDERGKLSEKQEGAARKVIADQAKRNAELHARDAGSVHVGTVGKRQEFTATLTGYTVREGMYGVTHIHFMKDADGNVLFYSGSNKLCDKGETVTFVASVKSHGENNGVKTTRFQRPKLKA